MITFDSPLFLFLLLFIPLFWGLRSLFHGFRFRLFLPVDIWQGEKFKPRIPFIRLLKLFNTFLLISSLVLMIIALAGPSFSYRKKIFLTRGIDIIFVLDESPSMSAQDFTPNRFEASRSVIREFVSRRENDPVGLVTFSREAALRVPPTLDYQIFIQNLNKIEIMQQGDGTSLGLGMATALLHLKNSTANEKILILLTDGENNSGEVLPETAIELAVEKKIRVYAIGVGSFKQTNFQFINPESGKLVSGKLQGSFNQELLENIASSTGGNYFLASNPAALESIFKEIASIENVRKRFTSKVINEPLHHNLIIAVLVLLLIWVFNRFIILRELL